MGEAVAEVYQSGELLYKGVRWDFDQNDGVVGWRDTGLTYDSGRYCLKSLTTDMSSFILSTSPNVVNPPFQVDSQGRISFASINPSDSDTLEIVMGMLSKSGGANRGSVILGANPIGAISGIYLYHHPVNGLSLYAKENWSWLLLASWNGVSLGVWYDMVLKCKIISFDASNNPTYKWQFEVYEMQLNADRTLANRVQKYIASGTRLTSWRYWGGGNIEIQVGYQPNAKIDYVRVMQGTGVSGL